MMFAEWHLHITSSLCHNEYRFIYSTSQYDRKTLDGHQIRWEVATCRCSLQLSLFAKAIFDPPYCAVAWLRLKKLTYFRVWMGNKSNEKVFWTEVFFISLSYLRGCIQGEWSKFYCKKSSFKAWSIDWKREIGLFFWFSRFLWEFPSSEKSQKHLALLQEKMSVEIVMTFEDLRVQLVRLTNGY